MSISRALTGSALAPATIPDAAAIDLGSAPGGAGLRVGPILRHVGEHDATIWVETTGPARVAVRVDDVEVEARTFQVAGHTYAMVVLEGLPSGATLPYEVAVDDVTVWPAPGSEAPRSVIRTIDPTAGFRVIFGSCRSPVTVKVDDPTGSGEDVLGAWARRMAGQPRETWPDALLMLGDQVYADETSPLTRDFIRSRRDPLRPPHFEVADFEEYTRLYAEAWTDPDVRWLLSTIPSSMIFDDHDVLDDWNTSRAWRDEIRATSWWQERITGALMSYWIYQHLGNLSPAQLAENELFQGVCRVDDAEPLLREFAQQADREPDGGPGYLWSFRRDFGRVRLLVIDSRCGRVLTEGQRRMISEAEFSWVEAQVQDGDYDHLLVGTSVPWLLPRALHDVEAADEQLTAGVRGRWIAWLAERARRAVDLEHWAAFNDSFERLARLFGRIGRGEDGAAPPATICVLSGDVHHTYISQVAWQEPTVSNVFQITCSPLHNSIPLPMRLVFTLAWSRYAERFARIVSRFARVPSASISWSTTAGPYFGNHLGSLRYEGRNVTFGLQKSAIDGGTTRATPVTDALRSLAELGPVALDPS